MADLKQPVVQGGLNSRVDAVKDDAGQWWISHTIAGPGMSFSYGVPLDQADTYFRNLADHARSLIREAKRNQLGIVLPDDGITKRTVSGLVVPDKPNGHK